MGLVIKAALGALVVLLIGVLGKVRISGEILLG